MRGRSPPPTLAAIANFGVLCQAAHRAAGRKRSSVGVCRFLADLEPEVFALERELLGRTYAPRPYQTFAIRHPKPRLISAADFRDRVVHHALCAAIEPTLERFAVADSFACRVGKGMHAALQRLQQLSRKHRFALRLDVRHFFATVDHRILAAQLARRVPDEGVLWLVGRFLGAGAPGCESGKGLPVGNLTSQHFGNFYLGHLDRHVKQGLRAHGYVRYMDDMVLLADDKAVLWDWHDQVARWLETHLALTLKATATRVLPVTEGVPYLGFRVWPGLVRFGPLTARRWRRRMRALDAGLASGALTEEAASRVAQSLLGWARHANSVGFRRTWCARRSRAGEQP